MPKHAFHLPRTAAQTDAAIAAGRLPAGLTRELIFEQIWGTGGTGPRLVVLQEGESAGSATSLGSALPAVEFVFEAAPPTLPGDDVHVVAPPLAAGVTEEWLAFCREVATRQRAQLEAQRARIGMAETVFLQRGPVDSVVAVIEGVRPWEEGEQISASNDDFDTWFLGRLAHFHGFADLPDDEMPARNRLIADLRAG